jgi:hypothetical protein
MKVHRLLKANNQSEDSPIHPDKGLNAPFFIQSEPSIKGYHARGNHGNEENRILFSLIFEK